MQTVSDHHSDAHRRPAAPDLLAAGLLAAAVVLHVVAMFLTYYGNAPTLASQPDQATLYGIGAASWALALAVGLTGPHRTPIAAGLAVGVALGEVGFLLVDVGQLVASPAGPGLWVMCTAWGVGTLGALTAVLAARRRHAPVRPAAGPPTPVERGTAVVANPYGEADATTELVTDPTVQAPVAGVHSDTQILSGAALAEAAREHDHERAVWGVLVVVLAVLTAGALLPAWDHFSAVSNQTGRTIVSENLGNVFKGPWQPRVGSLVAAAILAVVPIVAIRLRNKAVAAAVVVGLLLGIAGQLASAVVQVNLTVQPANFGFTPSQVSEYGLVLALKLTGWFTVEALAAYGLFAAFIVWANLRTVEEPAVAWAGNPRPPALAEPTRDPLTWP